MAMAKPLELYHSLVSKDVFDVNLSQIAESQQAHPL